jgi:hypothetical protein
MQDGAMGTIECLYALHAAAATHPLKPLRNELLISCSQRLIIRVDCFDFYQLWQLRQHISACITQVILHHVIRGHHAGSAAPTVLSLQQCMPVRTATALDTAQ